LNELERRLKRSLTEVRDAGRAGADARRSVARDELLRRIRRRRLLNVAGSAALAGVTAVAAFLVFSDLTGTRSLDERRNLGPAEVPAPARAAVTVGEAPSDVSVGGLNFVWAANSGDASVSRIDPSTNAVIATVPLDAAPGDIAIGEGPVWVSLPSLGQVVEVSPSEATVVGEPIQVADGAVGDIELSVGAGALWAVVPEEGLTRIPLDVGEPVALEVEAPTDVAVREDTAWVLTAEGSIVVIDSATGQRTGSEFAVPPSEDGELTFARGALWHLATGGETLSRLDPETGEVLDEVGPRGTLVDFVIDPEVAWILSAEGDTHLLTFLDSATLEVGVEFEVEGAPTEAVIAGGSLWLSLSESDLVLRFSKFP
jgi:YVTN family beta-propeller protein